MATHQIHKEKGVFYFVTFTCYKWLSLIEASALYEYLPSWFRIQHEKGLKTVGYVIMPNHIHFISFLEPNAGDLNQIISEGKRFMAYEIIKRLKSQNRYDLLQILAAGVQKEELAKGKKHQVFRLSFDAKKLEGYVEITNVLDYIHHNPVKGKWNLVHDFTKYPYSSAGYYECDCKPEIELFDFRNYF
jgi:REP element-mobilizing transposase RayT